MPVRRRSTALCAAAMMLALGALPTAAAAGQPWTGRYAMVTYASQKGGTSPAARQQEPDFSAVFTVNTSCSSSACVATADGPASSNPTVPSPLRYSWDGQQWKSEYSWVWDCTLGAQREWAPAESWTYYAPQPDGSLRGMWHTDIASGACRGSVVMPVAAVPAG